MFFTQLLEHNFYYRVIFCYRTSKELQWALTFKICILQWIITLGKKQKITLMPDTNFYRCSTKINPKMIQYCIIFEQNRFVSCSITENHLHLKVWHKEVSLSAKLQKTHFSALNAAYEFRSKFLSMFISNDGHMVNNNNNT